MCACVCVCIRSYQPSFPVGLLDNILYLHRCCKFSLVGQRSSRGNITYDFVFASLHCPACLFHLIWIVLEIGDKWLYS